MALSVGALPADTAAELGIASGPEGVAAALTGERVAPPGGDQFSLRTRIVLARPIRQRGDQLGDALLVEVHGKTVHRRTVSIF